MFEIQHGVPVPSPTRVGPAPLYPLRKMKVGDSFSIPAPGGPDELAKTAYRAFFAVQNVRRKDRSLQFKVRRQGDHVGVWRTA